MLTPNREVLNDRIKNVSQTIRSFILVKLIDIKAVQRRLFYLCPLLHAAPTVCGGGALDVVLFYVVVFVCLYVCFDWFLLSSRLLGS